jgi:hypothetical protein
VKLLESLETTVERRRNWIKPVLVLAVAGIIVMWAYIFLLAPKNEAGSIDDAAWTAAAQQTCVAANTQITNLPFVDPSDNSPANLKARAASVDRGNQIIAAMLADLGRTEPANAVGKTIVTKWLDDWRTYLADRVNYATGLAAGTTTAFGESQIGNAPISDFIGPIADHNHMAACRPIPLS